MLPVRLRLAEIVEERAKPHRERRVCVRRRLHDLEDVLVEREVLALAALLETDRRLELRQERA